MKIKHVLIGLALMAPTMIVAGEATGLAGLADGITTSMNSFGKLMMSVAFIAGLGFVISGLIKFKAHKDNPQQVPLGQPITLLIVGACLTFLPSIINVTGDTLLGSSKTSAGTGGAGLTALDGGK